MAKKTPRPRSLRRAAAQSSRRALDRLEQLAAQLPGGSPERPLRVTSASVIEVRARAARCLACDGELELHAHVVDDTGGANDRRVELACRSCRVQRWLWFRIEPPASN
jgi:hypothetical protein